MTVPNISVIVPVYNSELYLHRCIDSILSQNYTNIELLLVDDGSSDASSMICDGYALIDKRVRVFHQTNGGVTSARRKGVEEAKGEWVSFVDSDDELVADALSVLCSHVNENIDVIVSEYGEVREITSDEFVMMTLCSTLYSSLWGRLYRRTAVIGHMDHISNQITIGEDTLLNVRIGCASRGSVLLIPQRVYNYYENPMSAMRTRTVSLEYETFFLQELHNALGSLFSQFKDGYYFACLNSLELLVVCRLSLSYKSTWIDDTILWARTTKSPLTFRQWLVIHFRQATICRYLLAAERRIGIMRERLFGKLK